MKKEIHKIGDSKIDSIFETKPRIEIRDIKTGENAPKFGVS
jgi:hypothetical protein